MRVERIMRPDSDLVYRLYSEAGMTAKQPNPAFFNNNANILLVAFADAEPCGFLFAYRLDSLDSPQPMMFLYSIDVFPAWQRKGIGGILINELKEIAVKENCSELFVLTNDSNLAAKALYEKLGGRRENSDDVMYVYEL